MVKKNDKNLVNNDVSEDKTGSGEVNGANVMSDQTYYQKNRDKILNRANKYYQKNKETINEKPKKKYKELNDADKDIIKNDCMNRYNNMDGEAKMKLKEYRRNYYRKCKEQRAKEQGYVKNMQKEYENYNVK